MGIYLQLIANSSVKKDNSITSERALPSEIIVEEPSLNEQTGLQDPSVEVPQRIASRSQQSWLLDTDFYLNEVAGLTFNVGASFRNYAARLGLIHVFPVPQGRGEINAAYGALSLRPEHSWDIRRAESSVAQFQIAANLTTALLTMDQFFDGRLNMAAALRFQEGSVDVRIVPAALSWTARIAGNKDYWEVGLPGLDQGFSLGVRDDLFRIYVHNQLTFTPRHQYQLADPANISVRFNQIRFGLQHAMDFQRWGYHVDLQMTYSRLFYHFRPEVNIEIHPGNYYSITLAFYYNFIRWNPDLFTPDGNSFGLRLSVNWGRSPDFHVRAQAEIDYPIGYDSPGGEVVLREEVTHLANIILQEDSLPRFIQRMRREASSNGQEFNEYVLDLAGTVAGWAREHLYDDAARDRAYGLSWSSPTLRSLGSRGPEEAYRLLRMVLNLIGSISIDVDSGGIPTLFPVSGRIPSLMCGNIAYLQMALLNSLMERNNFAHAITVPSHAVVFNAMLNMIMDGSATYIDDMPGLINALRRYAPEGILITHTGVYSEERYLGTVEPEMVPEGQLLNNAFNDSRRGFMNGLLGIEERE